MLKIENLKSKTDVKILGEQNSPNSIEKSKELIENNDYSDLNPGT